MTRNRLLFLLISIFFATNIIAVEWTRVFDNKIRSLQVVCNDNPLLPPAIPLNKKGSINISWDEMSHEYHRYIYRITHCGWNWEPTEGLFESDWLQGTNGLPVEDYEKSFNTTQEYTHYAIRLPNSDAKFMLSGNYLVQIFMDEDGADPDECVLEARFSVYENSASLTMQVSSNTDIDFNNSHQQVSLALGYGTLSVVNPVEQIRTVVIQNRRSDRTVSNPPHNIQNMNGIEYTHNPQLIFDAGNEYYKYEILDVHKNAMGVDFTRWFQPYYHAYLWEREMPKSYNDEEDQNGNFVIRNEDYIDNNTASEYVQVHFFFRSERLPQDVYVSGLWTNGTIDPACRMKYNDLEERYEATILLKQGYYNYQFITADGSTARTMGNFWETENEYQVMVYYREQGGRYDRLVAYQCSSTSKK